MDLGDQLVNFLNDKMDSFPMKKVGDYIADKTVEDSRRGVDPMGDSYGSYAQSSRQSGRVNLRDRQHGIEDTKFNEVSSREGRVTLDGQSGLEGTSSFKPTSQALWYHQEGDTFGGRVRKTFPEKEDETSKGVQDKLNHIDTIIEDYFNE